ncbi:hypothetical protein JMJ55_13410 [Belnapia sp. T6]|uniref:Uncharacterized protein n=1 Tax=Belnapia mucosa TaxID=2804532 RepID=A0ABS1V3R7_9PROT|nr:hypothetical protein [Belnapia mucosa]MBL6456326.1 hypothetical protein [Belnapia mucosa]
MACRGRFAPHPVEEGDGTSTVVQRLEGALETVLGTPELLRFLAQEGAAPSRMNSRT